MAWPQVIVLVWLILGAIVVPANDELYWKLRYSLAFRLIRTSLWLALLWWGGFFGG